MARRDAKMVETVARNEARRIASLLTPEQRSQILRDVALQPEARARRSASHVAWWRKPGTRDRMSAAIRASRTPEFLAALADRGRAQWQNPEVRARNSAAIRARLNSPKGLTEREAKKARPCKVCGGPRTPYGRKGDARCKPCHTKRVREAGWRRAAILEA